LETAVAEEIAMCDIFPGELLICHHKDDPAAGALIEDIRLGRISHVSYEDRLNDRLYRLEISIPDIEFEVHKVRIPDADEVFKINYLQFYYKHHLIDAIWGGIDPSFEDILSRSNTHFIVCPNSVQSFGGALSFTLSPHHKTYKGLLGLPHASGSTGAGVTITVLDSGIAQGTGFNINHAKSRNFSDDRKPKDIDDALGHGTAVSSLISDLAPDAKMVMFKVAERTPISEWDTLTALVASAGSDVVNLSLAFGLTDFQCPQCGRLSHASRSAIFENIVGQILRAGTDTIVVVAAGNTLPQGQNQLAYPARFGEVIAVGALDSKCSRSPISNYGAVDHVGDLHSNVFFVPGGGSGEFVGSTANPAKNLEGTSFAAAYASGLVALYLSQPTTIDRSRHTTLGYFRTHADRSFPAYSHREHGNGLMKIA
jgi:subtilisin family serine protease